MVNSTIETTEVERAVDRLLKHALLVSHDDLRCTEIEKAHQAVVTMDNAAIQIVQIRSCKAATLELDHRTQIRRDDRNDIKDHVGWLVVGLRNASTTLETLDGLRTLLAFAA